jgi:hypothetical protein
MLNASAKSKNLGSDLGLPEEELQVSAAQDAVVLDVAGQVDGAGAVHGAVHLHVAVDEVQVLLLVLRQTDGEKTWISILSGCPDGPYGGSSFSVDSVGKEYLCLNNVE